MNFICSLHKTKRLRTRGAILQFLTVSAGQMVGLEDSAAAS
jgi:hypothetical protein